jgi:hypothetical protein
MAKTSEDLLDEVIAHLPSIAKRTAEAIPVFMEMMDRLRTNPDEPGFYEIVYPGTDERVFTEDQGGDLEDKLREVWSVEETLEEEEDTESDVVPIVQHGGGFLPPDVKESIKSIVGVSVILRDIIIDIGGKVKQIKGTDVSIDKAWLTLFKPFLINLKNNILPELAKHVKDASQLGGLAQFESKLQDLTGVITIPIPVPPFLIPIPYRILAKLILPILAVFLDVLRFTISTVPFVGTLTSFPFTILLSLLELGKGNLYNSLSTLLGVIGTNGIVAGIFFKLFLAAMLLLEPTLKEIPDEIFDVGYKASKTLALTLLLHTLVFVPSEINIAFETLMDSFRKLVRGYNQQVTAAKEKVAQSSGDRVHLEMKLIDMDELPTFMDPRSFVFFAKNPYLLTYPGVMDFLMALLELPLLGIIFRFFMDAASIPLKGSPEFQELLEKYPHDSLAKQMTPRLTVKTPTGDYTPIEDIKPTTLSNITAGLQDAAGDAVGAVTAPLTSAVRDAAGAATATVTGAVDGAMKAATTPLTSAVGAAAPPTGLPVPAKTARVRAGGARRTRKTSRNLRNRG